MSYPGRENGRDAASGFTLLELSVVLAMLAVLTVMLLPAMSRTKMKADQINCLSNVKQLTVAAVMYQRETGESPGSIAYGAVASLWMETLITRSAPVSGIRLCPNAPERTPRPGSTAAGDATTAWHWLQNGTNYSGSYGINGWLYTYEGTNEWFPDMNKYFPNSAAMASPHKTPFFMDAIWPDLWPDATPASAPARNLFTGELSSGKMSRCTIARHLLGSPKSAPRNVPAGQALPGGITMSFADAHVETVRLENLWQYHWHNNYQAPAVRPP